MNTASSNSDAMSEGKLNPLHSTTAIVHTQYDIHEPPPVPGPGWTRFVCISDTHSRRFAVPDGDVLLHSGDLTNSGTYKNFSTTVEWLASLPHRHKIIIAGNHDLPLDTNGDWYEKNWERWHHPQKEDRDLIRDLLLGETATSANIKYLEDEKFEFHAKEGGRLWSVYGSPWSPHFYNWAFNYERGAHAEKIISAIPKTDILLTHAPPFGIFDMTTTNEQVGCEALAARLATLRPRLHVFGHIHEAHGALIRAWDPHAELTVFVNAANWPMGPRARPGVGAPRIEFGQGPFQPVIVDLLDKL